MPTIRSYADVFDREVGCGPHWSRSDSGRDPKSIVYPSQAMPERRKVSRHSTGPSPTVEQISGKVAERSRLTPSQWLSQWCCLDEQT